MGKKHDSAFTTGSRTLLYSITWECEVCKRTRPDKAISVHKVDLSEAFGIAVGTCMRNIKYCNDNGTCHARAIAEGEKEQKRAREIKEREPNDVV